MSTATLLFLKLWGVVTPSEAAEKIEKQRKAAGITDPKNLEEQAISLVGTDVYEKLIKGYTQKQWGSRNKRRLRPCKQYCRQARQARLCSRDSRIPA